MTDAQSKKSDLPVRIVSAVVMVAVAGAALWLGGRTFNAFAILVGAGVLWEWWTLVRRFVGSAVGRAAWLTSGAIYIGAASISLIRLRDDGIEPALATIALVIAVDVGAYFAGRTVGGPKIAAKISPSKTWAGLIGGVVCASAALATLEWTNGISPAELGLGYFLLMGSLVAVTAQAGDFFESWMKRRAGVKDSGNLIPGHGGLFDRNDGLIAVLFMLAVFQFLKIDI